MGLATLTWVALAAGCDRAADGSHAGPAETAAGGAAAARAPIDQLTGAVQAVTAKGFTYQARTSRGTIDGAADLPNGTGKVHSVTSVSGTDLAVDLLILKTDYYLKVTGIPFPGVEPGTFMRVRAEKLKSDEVFGVNLVDPSNTKNLSGQFTSVQRRGDGGFAGTLDLTKGSAFGITRQVINAMGESANFGAPVTIDKPADANVVEAPPALYRQTATA